MFTAPVLIEGEEVLYRKGANLVVRLDEAGLDPFCADQLMWAIGMSGKEAMGGHLYITNYRLIFAAHRINRLTGTFSIPLRAVRKAYRKVRFPVFKLIIETDTGGFEFVNWSAKKAIEVIEANRSNDTPDLDQVLDAGLSRNEALCGFNALFLSKDRLKQRWNDHMSQ